MRLIYVFSLVLLLSSCKKTQVYLATVRANTLAINDHLDKDTSIDRFIAPYKTKLDAEMNRILSYTPLDMTKKDSLKQTTLGNLTADICFNQASAIYEKQTGETIDFALFNYGGLRTIFSKGNITKGDVFKVMPFENELVVVTLSGDKMEELIAFFIRSSRTHPISKQIGLELDKDSYMLRIKGQDFDKTRTYRVLTSDYLQNGGSNMTFFKDPIQLYPLNYKVRTALIDYLQEIDTVKVQIDQRIRLVR